MITQAALRRSKVGAPAVSAWFIVVVEVAAAYFLGRLAGWWVAAAVLIVALELLPVWLASGAADRRATLWRQWPGIVVGIGIVLIMTLVPRHATQIGVTALYAVWAVARQYDAVAASKSFLHLLIGQAVAFEAVFLMAAIWQTPSWLVLALVWALAYTSVYATLRSRGDRSAGVIAATWGVVATEVAWVLMLWLITYTMNGGYLLVPQPALILTALAYVMGSILASSRQGKLSRARLAEYLVIAGVLVAIVVVGTSWHGNV